MPPPAADGAASSQDLKEQLQQRLQDELRQQEYLQNQLRDMQEQRNMPPDMYMNGMPMEVPYAYPATSADGAAPGYDPSVYDPYLQPEQQSYQQHYDPQGHIDYNMQMQPNSQAYAQGQMPEYGAGTEGEEVPDQVLRCVPQLMAGKFGCMVAFLYGFVSDCVCLWHDFPLCLSLF